MRSPVQPTARPQRLQTFPAPVGGWIKNQNLATPGARRPDGTKVNGAAVLDNWFPTATGIRMRRGSSLYAAVGNGQGNVRSLFTYINGNTSKLFAATEAAIYDASTLVPQDYIIDSSGYTITDEEGNGIIPEITGNARPLAACSSADWVTVQTANADGDVFLRAVNGVDTPLVFDGSDWSASSFPITGVNPKALSYVWSYKRRTWFVERESLNAWYLDVDAIGGAATIFPLAGIFTRGGKLVFGSTWSLETSSSGLSEQQIFVTSEGEIAVYQGNDPNDATTWALVGVYRTGKPLGPKAHIRAGGDVVVATDIGFLPVSTSISRDYAALSPAAVSYNIEVAWNEYVADRSFDGWSCEVWPTQQMVVVALPSSIGQLPMTLVANARTGAWARYTGWDAHCVQTFNNRLFFGSSNGQVIEAEVTGYDQEEAYTASCAPLFDTLRTPASLKFGLLSRATLLSTTAVEPQLALISDYIEELPSPPDVSINLNSNVWDNGVWDSSIWDAPVQTQIRQQWQSVGGQGYALSISAQITSDSIVPPDIQLVSIDLTYDVSDLVT